jgi:L-seryl-tRNA(Ser) seleniumtransferase
LPKVDELLDFPEVKELSATYPRPLVVEGVRKVIDDKRGLLLALSEKDLEELDLSVSSYLDELEVWLKQQYALSLKRLINATGVVIHTNLGRSILSKSAIEAVVNAASNYSNLEFDLEKGARGSRHSHIEKILVKITGAEAGMVVNNNASAVFLAPAKRRSSRAASSSKSAARFASPM